MIYGNFAPHKREYIITTPFIPSPWINYLGNADFGGIISHTGGGYCFDRDPRNKRVLRYRYNNIPEDQPGRYIYIKDIENNNYWSATWQPVKSQYKSFECRHGPGYTIISQENNNIFTEIKYFIPLNRSMEIWWLKVQNTGKKTRKLDLFTYAEFSFFDTVRDQQNLDWTQQIQQGSFENNTIFWNAFMKKTDYTFMTSNLPVKSFETSRENFIGKYRDLSSPLTVEKGECENYEAHRGNGAGVLNHEIILKPGEEKQIVYYLGTVPEKKLLKNGINKFYKIEQIKSEFNKLNEYWNKFFNKCQVKTPDKEMNLMLNTWNPYQCKTTFNWSRFVSLYQLGINRGMGFRDSAQDILGVVHAIPEECRDLIIRLLKCQHPEGNSYHLFYPLTGKGSSGEAGNNGNCNWYSDDHLWIIISVTAYIKESGDKEFLEKKVSYSGVNSKETVLEHLCKALEFTENHRGKHGLPLIGFADWNDTLNLQREKQSAESVWTGMLYCYTLKEMSALMNYIGREDLKNKYLNYYYEQKKAINTHGWDESWYLRAFAENGNPLGSRKSESGKIFLNPQSWAIISEIAEQKKGKMILKNVKEYLDSKYGVTLLYPAYSAFDEKIGGLTTYPPGAKENGGIFMHANPWLIIAEVLSGNHEQAYRYYRKVLPPLRDDPDLYRVEPYVYCQNVLGKEHPQFGLGSNSWLTGTAAWMYRAAINYILGIRPDYDGIIIKPSVPDNWDEFKVKRKIRDKVLNIIFKKSNKTKILLNENPTIKNNFIYYSELAKSENEIVVKYK